MERFSGWRASYRYSGFLAGIQSRPWKCLLWIQVHRSVSRAQCAQDQAGQPVRLGMGLRATCRVRNLGFRSPIPQIVCVESDTEKIGRKEPELLRSHSNDTNDDAVCSSNDPALPSLLPYEDRREDGQKAGQIIKPQHFPPRAPSISLLKVISSAV